MRMNKQVYEKRRFFAVLMVMVLLCSILQPIPLFASETDSSSASYQLVNLSFTEKKALPYSDNATGITATLQRENETADKTADYSSYGLSTKEWNEGAYWQLSFSAKNFKDLTFDAWIRSSNTAPANFRVSYSTDGTNFTDLTEMITLTGKNEQKLCAVKLPELADNQETVRIRIYCAGEGSVNGKSIESAGVSNINNIVVTGTSIDGTFPECPVSTEPEVSESPSAEPEVTPSETASTEPEDSKTPVTSVTPAEPVTYYDPILEEEIPEGAITIKQAYETADAAEVTIVGQVQYKYGKNGAIRTTIIEDVIDGAVWGFQVYDALSDCSVGDVIAITGKISTYGEVKQLQSPAGGSFSITTIKKEKAIGPQELTMAQLLAGGDAYLSEYVVIKEVTLGAYNASNTPITDASGNIMNIYQASAYPEDLTQGSQANVYGVWSKYKTTYQLRNGKSEDSYKKTGYEVDAAITTQLAKWAGTAKIEGTTAYGDLYADNDFLDKDAKLTLSTGNAPQYVNGTEYCLGSKGLKEGNYYQLELSSEKYAALEFSFKLRSSNSGVKYYKVLYSTDGINFEPSNLISYTLNKTTYNSAGEATNTSETHTNVSQLEATASWQTYNVAFTDAAANAEKLYIRLQVADNNSRIDGKTGAISNTYTCRLTSILVTGSPIIAEDICGLVSAEPGAGAIAAGSEITLTCQTEGASIYYKINDGEEKQYDAASKPVLSELPATITAYAKVSGKEESVKITYAYAQAQAATVKGSPNGGSVKLGKEVKLSCDTEGSTIYYSLDNGQSYKKYTEAIIVTELPCTIKTYASKEGYQDSEVRTLHFTERTNEHYNLYFGQIHAHTNFSDGAGSPDDAYQHASTQVDNLDFLAITDHSNYFDNDTSATITDGSMSEEWVAGNALAEKYTTDKFVGLFGYEMTWSGGAPGHMNTFNTAGFLSRNTTGYGNGSSSSLVNYYAALKTVADSISQFNHPGTTFGDFYDFGYYDDEIDQLITTIEVGNGEGAIGSTGYFPSYEYYTRALDKGWHVAPTNNQDNHKGNWGSANTARTVVLADSLTRENIYDALRNMRTYATEDSNLSIQYTLNDEVMGTILEETPDSVNIAVSLNDADTTDTIGKVEVIVNGGLSIASKTIAANSAEVTFTLSPDYSYYYIKVTEGDGDIAVTAPVWISDVDAAGVASVTTTSAMPIQKESVDVTAEFYNNNDYDMEISSVEFLVEDKSFYTLEGEELSKAGLGVLASQSTEKYTLDLCYDGLGNTAVTVKLNAVAKGVAKVYTGKLELNYVPREMVSKVLIDGTHSNDYVSGYYSGKINTLAKLAAQYYEEVITKTDSITAEDLKDCSLLIISAPAKSSGTNGDGKAYAPTNFDDAFLKLVAEYVKNGGKVVLCGIADYKDCETSQTSTELNKLLEAMGATTRVNSDELIDDVNYSNQNYRLYFDDYNRTSPYMNGFIDGMTYSSYSGCGILLDANAVAAKTAEAIVYGHDTTYSIDSKKLDSNYKEQEKGSLVALATERVGDNGGRIWVGGTVFLSDYEIDEKVKQNTDELSYANTVIVSNILKEAQKEKTITDIADVRKAEMGEIFTIEGYVTAGTTNIATTFFDCIYVQDDTAGIDIFPFSQQGVAIGQKIRITGYVAEYQGDKELMVMNYELLEGSKIYKPLEVSTKDAADYENFGGRLIKVTGKVTKVEYAGDVLNYIHIQDESGVTCKVLTDGYIGSSTGIDNTKEIAKVGNKITAAGVLYMNPDGACIRTRDRAEIVLIGQPVTSEPSEPLSYQIAYFLNGGKNSKKNPSVYTEGTTTKLVNPKKTGYTFAGWYTDSALKKKLAENTISAETKGNIKLYAKWTANKYTIAFAKNSKTAKGTMKTMTAVYNKSVKLKKSSFTRKGYVFAGWARSTKGKAVYKDAASVKNLTSVNGKKITLYAVWKKVVTGQTKSVAVKSSGAGKVKVSWKSVSSAENYQIVYSASKSFQKAKTVTVGKKTSATLSGLRAGTTYYVKVRAYKKDSQKNKVYGSYSTIKKVTIQKKK